MQSRIIVISILLLIIILSILFLKRQHAIPEHVEQVLNSTNNRKELQKVIDHYHLPEDSLKLKAAFFLIGNMDGLYSHQGSFIKSYKKIISKEGFRREQIIPTVDSLKMVVSDPVTVVRDMDAVTADFLINNIEMAFEAWEKPWARHLSFNEFCEYILPYRILREPLEEWRYNLHEKFKWINDSLGNERDTKKACILINNQLSTWFFHSYSNYPYSSVTDLFKARTGSCTDMTLLATYAMRSVGVPVAVDYTPIWANRSSGHIWNTVLYPDGRNISFMGSQRESNPGLYKLEMFRPGKGIMRLKRSKVFRRTFAKQPQSLALIRESTDTIPDLFLDPYFKDVTTSYLPVSNVQLVLKDVPAHVKFAYICTFDNANWVPVHWSEIKDGKVLFGDMGKGIAYMIMYYKNGGYLPLADPFILEENGKIRFLKADTNNMQQAKLLRKYPINESNEIEKGDVYSLFYWDKEWIPLGVQVAEDKHLNYRIPANSLLWLRDLTKGAEERIFTLNNGKQTWW